MRELWVFGYGSLLWQPGFEFVHSQVARLEGYTRSFCMRSIHHRGTEEKPGLVLALDADADGFCDGIAFKVAPENVDKTLAYLRERELISSAYLEVILPLTLSDGTKVDAVCYVINRDHVQYCQLALEDQAHVMATAVGNRGPNTEYLYNTAAHLADIGLADTDLDWLSARVRELVMNGSNPTSNA